MHSKDARLYAEEMIAKWIPDFTFIWDTKKRVFGSCIPSLKVIKLSLPLTLMNSDEQVKDTILHEIAHGLAGPGHGHDDYWKMMCIRVGAKPVRCYDSVTVNTPHSFEATCECGIPHKKFKQPRTTRICLRCRKILNFVRVQSRQGSGALNRSHVMV
jgi:predicted SprT family Zn-dependent metalloprotease